MPIEGITVVVPVGPGHQKHQETVLHSIQRLDIPGDFNVEILIVPDYEGKVGRSRSRNNGAREASYEWIFFLDADDLMHPAAVRTLLARLETHPQTQALWGRSMLETWYNGRLITNQRPLNNIYTPLDLLTNGPFIGICVGFFVTKTALFGVGGWYEPWDFTEDHELFYALINSYPYHVVRNQELATIRLWVSRADGPRGYDSSLGADSAIIKASSARAAAMHKWWVERGPGPLTEEEVSARKDGTFWDHLAGVTAFYEEALRSSPSLSP